MSKNQSQKQPQKKSKSSGRGQSIAVLTILGFFAAVTIAAAVTPLFTAKREDEENKKQAEILNSRNQVSKLSTECQTAGTDTETKGEAPVKKTSTGKVEQLKVTDIALPSGDATEVSEGDCVVIQYNGYLAQTGEVFDSSYSRANPFSVLIGYSNVIQGWDEGLIGLKEGGTYHLQIPAAEAYGESSRAPAGVDATVPVDEDDDGKIDWIPPNSDLIFDVNILQVIPNEFIEM